MHELGIAQGMLQAALDTAAQNHGTRITAFNIEMSILADESEDSLRFHFENLTRGTIAEGARVEIVRVPAQVKCLECAHESTLNSEVVCPACGSARLRPVVQDEFKLVSIDVE